MCPSSSLPPAWAGTDGPSAAWGKRDRHGRAVAFPFRRPFMGQVRKTGSEVPGYPAQGRFGQARGAGQPTTPARRWGRKVRTGAEDRAAAMKSARHRRPLPRTARRREVGAAVSDSARIYKLTPSSVTGILVSAGEVVPCGSPWGPVLDSAGSNPRLLEGSSWPRL